MKLRFDIIQYLINTLGYTSYLELGCRLAENSKLSIDHIQCLHKDSVDINSNGNNYVMSTNKFFDTIDPSKKYDIIFIDADHEKSAVKNDILNALKHLNDFGCIVCHDINPKSEMYLAPRYCNNAWETWAELRSTNSEIEMYALDVDMTGVIRKGSQTLYSKNIEYTWNYLDSNRTELLNVIDIETFKQIFKK
jgi:hypothetical protein